MSRGLSSKICRVGLVCLLMSSPGVATALEAGAAKAELPLELGAPLDGYAWRMGRGAMTANETLWVRALFLEKDDISLLLVTADLYSIPGALRERVLDFVPAAVPSQHVILTATNTHNGPGGMSPSWLDRRRSGRYMPQLLERTARAFEAAMQAAYENRKRAVIGYAVSEENFLTRNAFVDDGPRDTQLGVVRVEDSDGTPIAILANFAAKPATLSDKYAFAFSADFPGRFCDALEEMSSPGVVAFYLNAASADQVCVQSNNQHDWALAESVGNSLAGRVKAIANTIDCRELKLHIAYSSRTLPLSIVPRLSPREALIQTLEIHDLLISFMPGAAYAEVGLELRKRARARGYSAHFTVGPANGAVVSFRPLNSFLSTASGQVQTLHGPVAAEWLYEGIAELMTRGEHEHSPPIAVTSEGIETFGSGRRVMLSGSPYERGYQRGLAFGEEIRKAYDQLVLDAIRDDSIEVDLGPWNLLRGAVDPAPLALVDLGNEALRLMRGLASSDVEEVQGLADAVELSFLAVWLLQTSSYFQQDLEDSKGFQDALFALTDHRAAFDGVLVAHGLANGLAQEHIVTEVRPDTGRGYVAVGAPWDLGVYSGMNDAGLVVCAEAAPDLGQPTFDAPPLGFVVRTVLMSETRFEDAMAALLAMEGLRGCRILVADRRLSNAAVIEFGAHAEVRTSADGLLVGRQEDRISGRHSRGRSERTSLQIQDRKTIGLSALQTIILKRHPSIGVSDRVPSREMGPYIVFETRSRNMHISFTNDEGVAEPFKVVTPKRERQ